MLLNILGYLIEFGASTVILSIAMLIMIKIQKLDFSVIGLLAAAGMSVVVEMGLEHLLGLILPDGMVVYVAAPITIIVLWIGIAKVTNADSTDVSFTVFVGYAVEFCIQLFLLGALMGDLTGRFKDEGGAFDADLEEEPAAAVATNKPDAKAAEKQPQKTNTTKTASQKADPAKAGKTAEPEKEKSEKGSFLSSIFGKKTEEEPPSPEKLKERADRLAKQIAAQFTLKGVLKTAKGSSAIVHTGLETYTIDLGDTKPMNTSGGSVQVTCLEIAEYSVVLMIGTEETELWLP